MELEFLPNQKGHEFVVYNGRVYSPKRIVKDKLYTRCGVNRNCSASLIVDRQERKVIKEGKSEHTCDKSKHTAKITTGRKRQADLQYHNKGANGEI